MAQVTHRAQVVQIAIVQTQLADRRDQQGLDQTARIWQLDPVVVTPADQRRAYVCRERLIGAQSFSEKEMQDPFLHGRDDLRNPCARSGPLSRNYYWRGALGLIATIRNAL